MNPFYNDAKFQEIYTELEVVKDNMEDNVFNLTNNVVKLEDLDQKANQIEKQSEEFQNKTSQFKYKDLCLKITIVSTGTIVLGGLILIFIVSNIYGKQQNQQEIQ
jgi:hypothetical protein